MLPVPGCRGRAAFVFLLLITAFLAKPLTEGGLYGPFDILHSWAMVKAPGSPGAKNPILSDVAIQILPFIGFNKSELSAGRIPLWNPYSSWGAPHLANGQSGVFSPFVLPMYLFDWRWGVLLSVYLRLFTAGFFTYLLLRRLGSSFWPSVSAGTLYMFSGTIMVWLLWQNSSVAAMLPVTIHAVERLMQMPGRKMPLVWLAAVLAVGMYSGHPELFFFIASALVLYAGLRLLLFPGFRSRWLDHSVRIAAACLLGVLLSAPQILPFTEYLRRSVEANKGGVRHELLPGLHWTSLILQIQPDLFGNPSEPFPGGAITNYSEMNSGYAGAGAYLLLAIAAVTFWWSRSRLVLLFGVLFCGWFVYVYDVFLWYPRFLHKVPLLGMPVPKRAATFGLFMLACIAGLTLDWLARNRTRARGVTIAGLAGFWAFGAWLLWSQQHRMFFSTEGAKLVLPDRLAAVFLSLLFVSIWAVARNPRWAFLLPVAFFFQTGYHMRGYTPTVQVRTPEGHSRAFDEIRRRVGGDMAMWEGETGMYSAINMWYGIRMGSNYDAMGLRSFDDAAIHVWGNDSDRYLHQFGMRWVVSNKAEPFKERLDKLVPKTVRPVRLAGTRLSQGFRAEGPRLNSIRIPFTQIPPPGENCEVSIEVAEEASGKVLAHTERPCPALASPLGSWVRFERVDSSRLQGFRVTVDGSRVPKNSQLSVLTSPEWAPGLALEAAAGTISDLEPEWSGDGYYLFRVRDSLPRFSTFGSAFLVPDAERAYARMNSAGFQPLRQLVIEGPGERAGVSEETAVPRVIEDSVTTIRLQVNRRTPGWFFALQPHYPGWSATVNGMDQPILRANACFSAVAIPAGESEIVLRYAPASFRFGVLLAFAGAAICGALAWRERRSA